MRKNVRNEKVIRVMTIGLATMLATTSMPMTVFADGEDGQTQSTEGTESPAQAAPATPATPATPEEPKASVL